jgi:MFS family permease
MWQIGAVTGPALGGLCYGLIGPTESLYIVSGLILLTLLFYSLISNKPVAPSNKNETIKESLKAGLNYFFKQQVLIAAITLDLFAVLFGGAVALLPAFADQVLHVGPEGLGILRSAPAIGSVLMSFLLAFIPPRKNAGNKMLICVSGFGLCMIGFALSENYYLSFAMLLLSGVFDNVSVVIRSTILQTYTPNEMRGRIAAVNSIFVGSSNEIGAFESGVAARLLGLVNSVVFGGCMTLVVTGITYKFAPVLRKLHL